MKVFCLHFSFSIIFFNKVHFEITDLAGESYTQITFKSQMWKHQSAQVFTALSH